MNVTIDPVDTLIWFPLVHWCFPNLTLQPAFRTGSICRASSSGKSLGCSYVSHLNGVLSWLAINGPWPFFRVAHPWYSCYCYQSSMGCSRARLNDDGNDFVLTHRNTTHPTPFSGLSADSSIPAGVHTRSPRISINKPDMWKSEVNIAAILEICRSAFFFLATTHETITCPHYFMTWGFPKS